MNTELKFISEAYLDMLDIELDKLDEVSIPKRSIRDIKGELEKHRAEYEAKITPLHAELAAKRAKRPSVKKYEEPYHEEGRSAARNHNGASY